MILAAGTGTRMGGPKALLHLDGETLLQRAVRLARAAGCAPVIAVIGPFDPGPLAAEVVSNPRPEEGLSSSLHAGLAAVPEEASHALFMTIDQPAVDEALLRRLCALAEPGVAAACAYGATLGVPALLPARLFPRLRALRGDQGARSILREVGAVPVPFPGGGEDLDTPEDLARLKR